MSNKEQRNRSYRGGNGERRIGRLASDIGEDDFMIEKEEADKTEVKDTEEAAERVFRPERVGQRPGRTASASGAATERTAYAWKARMQERKKRRTRILLAILGTVFVISYTTIAIHFGSHFYENTVIYGVDCSQMTVEQVKQEVAEKLDEYVLTIEEREGKTETIAAEQIDLEFVDNGSIDRMLKAQRSYIWPIMILLDRTAMTSVSFKYDAQKVEETLNTLDCYDILMQVAPKDAYIGNTDTGYEVVSEVMGTTLNRPNTLQAVLEALDAGAETVSLDEKDCYVNPEIYQDNEELNRDVKAMNELAGAYITYDFGPYEEIVDPAVMRDWLIELDDGKFVIDEGCVMTYVEELAAAYDTFGLPVDFYTSIGTTVTLSGGDYGWCIDQDQTFVELMMALENKYRGTMEPVYLYSAKSHENDGIGYTYVEICISQQRMWCYENGNCIVDTPVVTGNPNKDNATPSGGIWAIDAKMTEYVLEGEGYEAPVDYWMPFNEDVGIHDMKERAHFGGTIYLSNGSHGCVNTPYEAVQTIYNTVSIGTPVIVYE